MLASFLYIERRTEPGISGSPTVVMALSQIEHSINLRQVCFLLWQKHNQCYFVVYIPVVLRPRARCLFPSFHRGQVPAWGRNRDEPAFRTVLFGKRRHQQLNKLAHFRFSICTLLCFSQISFQETLLTVKWSS